MPAFCMFKTAEISADYAQTMSDIIELNGVALFYWVLSSLVAMHYGARIVVSRESLRVFELVFFQFVFFYDDFTVGTLDDDFKNRKDYAGL